MHVRAPGFFLPILFAGALISGCGIALGLGDYTDADGPATSASSGAGTGGKTGTVCTTPADCPGTAECVVASCNAGVCDSTYAGVGTAIAKQQPGDCKSIVCDGAGATQTVNDDTDLPVDGTLCTSDICTNGVATNPPTPADGKCGDNQGSVCDGSGKCVGCLTTADCTSPNVCKTDVCVLPQCADGKMDGVETGIDCGGGICPPCGNGLACNGDGDCTSGECIGGLCVSQCADGKKDGTETDVDCGGTCGGCANTQACGVDGDCKSGECVGNICECVVGVVADKGTGYTCARKGNGTLWCWGQNGWGQIGDGTVGSNKILPVQVTALGASVVQMGAGNSHTCARKGDGTLWCWGNNEYGQLGDGTTVDKPSPIQVAALGTNVLDFSLGPYHTCAVKTDYTLWCWGNNFHGELGDGTTVNESSPVQVMALGATSFKVAAGGDHNCAKTINGTLWCWGANSSGQVGDGTTVGKLSPVMIGPSAQQITAGNSHTCEFKTLAGGLWCWGYNGYGGLGDGTTVNELSPEKLMLPGPANIVAAGGDQTCIYAYGGAVWCWGKNDYGQLGDGTTVDKSSPVQVAALGASAVDLSVGEHHTCAVKADGTVWCWGYNAAGGLGDGTGVDKSSPVMAALTCP